MIHATITGLEKDEHTIEATTNNVVKRWICNGGDSLRLGFHSLWKGLLCRIPERQVLSGN